MRNPRANDADRFFSFPNPVNEKAARTVAGGVLVVSLAILLLSLAAANRWLWLCAVLAYGFLARVVAGPRLSPLGQFATRIIAPRLGAATMVAGPPKRFAQSIGLLVTSTILALVAAGDYGAAQILLAVMVVFAALESIVAYCVGCKVFAGLIRLGVIPQSICLECADVTRRARPDRTAPAAG
ncbi:MAG: DUF4395 domain-containing protein [Actinomycetota bacterium]|nr:DUF4395 domain-containing protein [Actinomycetota bacterium]